MLESLKENWESIPKRWKIGIAAVILITIALILS